MCLARSSWAYRYIATVETEAAVLSGRPHAIRLVVNTIYLRYLEQQEIARRSSRQRHSYYNLRMIWESVILIFFSALNLDGFDNHFNRYAEKWSPEKWSPEKLVPGKIGPRKNGHRKDGYRKNGPWKKWSPEKWSPEKMVPGKMVPGKRVPGKNGPRKNVL